MVLEKMDYDSAECYFCEETLQMSIMGSSWSRQRIRTNDGEVIVDTVCDDCNPRK